MKPAHRLLSLLLIVLLTLCTLSGCSAPAVESESSGTPSAQSNVESAANVPSLTEQNGLGLDSQQYNSLNMLNHLVALVQEINDSDQGRRELEKAYSELFNNTNPESVDALTLTQITDLLDTMEKYRMVSVKRERLQYVYEQDRAQAVKELIPSPLAVLNAVQSFSLKRLVSSFIYMGVDAYSGYQTAAHEAEMEFVQKGWELDDEADAALHLIHKSTFKYIVETVQAYSLPGRLALTENAVSEFVKWKNKTNSAQKIQFFESNYETYRAFGPYWLTLAQCYYDVEDYEACLQAVDEYEALNISIFRRNYDLAEVLPLAIVSARDTMRTEKYIETAERYAKLLLDNTDSSDWEKRYFAAQTYLELYSLSEDEKYLSEAYEITLNNVNELLEKQKELNQTYLADIRKAEIPKDASEEQKKEIKQYNQLLTDLRTTELPPVYEPLLLNCELLFALMEDMDEGRQQRARDILCVDDAPVFLLKPLNQLYSFTAEAEDAENIEIEWTKASLTLPAEYVSDGSVITVTVTSESGSTVFDDWSISKVERKTAGEIASFTAVYTSENAKQFRYQPGMSIHIEVLPKDGSFAEAFSVNYQTVGIKHLWVIPDVAFERVD